VGYGYAGGGGYEYGEGSWPPDEPLARGGGYEYGEGALPPDEPLSEGGGYRYGGIHMVEMGGMDMVERSSNHRPEVGGLIGRIVICGRI
jgi:hypothetical protein